MTLPARGILVGCQSRITPVQRRGARSLAYDLSTGQGVVSGRAALILRSVETYPLIGRFDSSFKLRTYPEPSTCLFSGSSHHRTSLVADPSILLLYVSSGRAFYTTSIRL